MFTSNFEHHLHHFSLQWCKKQRQLNDEPEPVTAVSTFCHSSVGNLISLIDGWDEM